MSQIHLETLDAILEKHQCDPSQVIAIMQDIQKEYHYLPESALCYTARKLGISDAKIYGVATFYENFSLEPKGKYVIKVCDGTACHVRKSVPILEEIRKQLNVTEKRSPPPTTCCSPWRLYPVWEPAAWLPSVPSMIMYIRP